MENVRYITHSEIIVHSKFFKKRLTSRYFCVTILAKNFLDTQRYKQRAAGCESELTFKLNHAQGVKAMDELKTLFGSDSLDYATFEQKVGAAGIKLANLAGGRYVGKDKYDGLNSEFEKYKADNAKYADYDSIKAERDTLKAEKAERELSAKVTAAGVGERFTKFVMSEVSALVTDKKDFDTALKEYLAANPQFAEQEQPRGFFSRGSTAPNMQGGDEGKKTINQKMNNLLRGKNQT